MNKFTKEELRYLYRAVYERPHNVTEQMEDMRNKIQSMIDNYDNDEPSIYGPCNHCMKFHESSINCQLLKLK